MKTDPKKQARDAAIRAQRARDHYEVLDRRWDALVEREIEAVIPIRKIREERSHAS